MSIGHMMSILQQTRNDLPQVLTNFSLVKLLSLARLELEGLKRVEPLLIEAELLHAGFCLGLLWFQLLNAFDCVSQKQKILLKTENKSIIGVLTQ
jgi:hypothetical protein